MSEARMKGWWKNKKRLWRKNASEQMPRYHRVIRETHRERPKEAHAEQINDKTTWNCTIGTARLVRLCLQFLLINRRNARHDCECEVWEMTPWGERKVEGCYLKKVFWWTMRETHGGNKKKRGVENAADLLSLSIISRCDGHHGESLGVSVSRKKKKDESSSRSG